MSTVHGHIARLSFSFSSFFLNFFLWEMMAFTDTFESVFAQVMTKTTLQSDPTHDRILFFPLTLTVCLTSNTLHFSQFHWDCSLVPPLFLWTSMGSGQNSCCERANCPWLLENKVLTYSDHSPNVVLHGIRKRSVDELTKLSL